MHSAYFFKVKHVRILLKLVSPNHNTLHAPKSVPPSIRSPVSPPCRRPVSPSSQCLCFAGADDRRTVAVKKEEEPDTDAAAAAADGALAALAMPSVPARCKVEVKKEEAKDEHDEDFPFCSSYEESL